MCFRIKLLPRGLVQVLLIGLFAGCWTEYSPTEAHAAETPVIKGIVLIADQAQLRKIDGNTSAKTFLDTTATPWIDAAKLGEKLTPFQDRELDKLSADLVVAAITNYHKDVLDEPFVNVYTPPAGGHRRHIAGRRPAWRPWPHHRRRRRVVLRGILSAVHPDPAWTADQDVARECWRGCHQP